MNKIVDRNPFLSYRALGSRLFIGRECGALMNHDARGQREMNIAIPAQCVRDELLAILARKVRLPVVFGERCCADVLPLN